MGLTFGILRSRTSQDCYDEMMTSQRAKGARGNVFQVKIGLQATSVKLWLVGSPSTNTGSGLGPDSLCPEL